MFKGNVGALTENRDNKIIFLDIQYLYVVLNLKNYVVFICENKLVTFIIRSSNEDRQYSSTWRLE